MALLSRNKVLQEIGGLGALPVLSDTLIELQSQCGSKASGAEPRRIASIIERDIGLTARVLKVANSVLFRGRYGETGSVHQAVTRLGLGEVCSICITVGFMRLFPKASDLIALPDFWRHSIGVARVARHLALRADLKHASESVYSAGLLHDIGILVLDRCFNSEYRQVLSASQTASQAIFHTEREILGMDHGEIGGLVLRKWGMPQSMQNAVTFHNSPDLAPSEDLSLAQLIHVADFACSALGAMEPGDPLPVESSLGAWHDLGIDVADIRSMVEETEKELQASSTFIEY